MCIPFFCIYSMHCRYIIHSCSLISHHLPINQHYMQNDLLSFICRYRKKYCIYILANIIIFSKKSQSSFDITLGIESNGNNCSLNIPFLYTPNRTPNRSIICLQYLYPQLVLPFLFLLHYLNNYQITGNAILMKQLNFLKSTTPQCSYIITPKTTCHTFYIKQLHYVANI